MSYQVIARKWRPQDFDEVVFQDHVSRTLRNSIAQGRISHAYIFSGSRGIGKTSMARILAKTLNCKEESAVNPCGKCENCIEIKNGTSFDVIEIDGASNNSVDDIRELRENVNFAPVKSKYKIYIIDEVHMVTSAAFNALLKTLEEPPSHVIFIFATTEIHKIPETILSRCQKYFFKKIPVDIVVEHLKHIVAKEGYRISDKALYPIARASEGSMRDAQSLLDQVIVFSDSSSGPGDDEISEQDALSILGIVPVESYINQLKNIINTDAVSSILEIERIVTMGVDIPRYIAGFVDVFRSLRLIVNGVSLQELLGLSEVEISMLKEISSSFSDGELSAVFRLLNTLQNDLRFAGNERICLEMAMLDIISVKGTPSVASIIRKLEESGKGMGIEREPVRTTVKNEMAPLQETKKKNEIKNIQVLWPEFLNSISESRQYLHSILSPSKVQLLENNLQIRFVGSDYSYYSRILDSGRKEIIRKAMSELLGQSINVSVEIVENDDKIADEVSGDFIASGNESMPEELISSDNTPDDDQAPLPDAVMLKNPESEEFIVKNPAVEKIKNIFHGQLIDKGE